MALAAGSSRSEATLLAKRALVHGARGRFEAARSELDLSVDLHAERGALMMAASSRADRAMIDIALGRSAESDLGWARRHLVTGEADDQAQAMIDLTVIIGTIWRAWRQGDDPAETRAWAVPRVAQLLAEILESRRDVALRLTEAMVQLALRGLDGDYGTPSTQ